ncbi:hemicentin-1-like [Sycon ciliatum]|uniref:hemicentin-1-like n=1 Tax=Sycon ciliatum TaxID=27933 RepID=UPI0031F6E283
MTSSGNRTSPASYTSILPLTNVKYADRGHYTCVSSVNNTGFDGRSHMIRNVNATVKLSILVPPQISTGPNNVALVEGSSSSFICTSYGYPSPNIEWYHDGVQLPHTQINTTMTSSGNRTSPASYTSILPLTNVKYADRGHYTFVSRVNNTGFDGSSHMIHTVNATVMLSILVPPQISTGPNNVALVEGSSSSSFTCTSYGYPSPNIEWYHDGVQLPHTQINTTMTSSGNRTSPASYTSILPLTNVKYADRGHYTFVSRVNNTGFDGSSHMIHTVNATVMLSILVPPQISTGPNNVALVEGSSSSSFTCTSYGYPSPNIEWYHDGVQLPHTQINTTMTSSGNRTSPASYTSILPLTNVKYADRGHYTFVSRVNNTGFDGSSHMIHTVNATVMLSILVPPQISTGPNNVALVEGSSSSSFTCTSYGYPSPNIEWYHDGVQLPHTQINTTMTSSGNRTSPASYTSILPLTNVKYADRGHYTFVSRVNNTGFDGSSHMIHTVNATVMLSILVPPQISTGPNNVALVEGSSSSSFTCTSYGYPSPNIEWYHDGVQLPHTQINTTMTSSGNRTSPASYTSILPLTNVKYADRGHYTFVSRVNNTGFDGSSHMIHTVNATVMLSILVPPQISTGPNNVALVEGSSSSSFTCTSYGYPSPNIEWYHDGVQLPHTQINTTMTSSGNRTSPASYTSILPLTNVNYADRGHYTCVSSVNNTGFDGSSHMIHTVNATVMLSILGKIFSAAVFLGIGGNNLGSLGRNRPKPLEPAPDPGTPPIMFALHNAPMSVDQAAVPSVADVVQTASNTVTHHPPQVDSGPMDISLMQPALPPMAAPMAITLESSSIVPTVPRKLLDKITRGEYINGGNNLGSLGRNRPKPLEPAPDPGTPPIMFALHNAPMSVDQAAVPSVADVVQTASNTVTHHPPQVDSGPMDISLMQPALPPMAAPMAITLESSSIVPTVPLPKNNGKLHLIHHLSYPDRMSVNDGNNKDSFSLHYVTVDDAIELLQRQGTGALMAKLDIRNAFRLVPVAPTAYHLLGFQWQGQFYYDKRLNVVLSVFRYLGVPIADEKTVGPTSCLTFLGIELDSVQKVARLPQDKVDDIRFRLLAFRQRQSCRLRELEQLLGKLNFASRVITPGRTFMRRLYDAMLNVSKPYHRIRLSPECHLDLLWWSHLLDGLNGKSFFLDLQETLASDILIEADASGAIGHGAVYGTHWFADTWSPQHTPLCITFKDLYPISIACATWGHQWCRQRIRFHTDNEDVTAVLKSGTSRCPNVMSLLRRLFFICAKGNFMVTARHIP